MRNRLFSHLGILSKFMGNHPLRAFQGARIWVTLWPGFRHIEAVFAGNRLQEFVVPPWR